MAIPRFGRWQAGADVLASYDKRFANPTALGLAGGWLSFDIFATERGFWCMATGPRLAAGAVFAIGVELGEQSRSGKAGDPILAMEQGGRRSTKRRTKDAFI